MTSIEPKQIVRAEVVGYTPEERGIYIRAQGVRGFVPVYEFFWEHSRRELPREAFQLGEVVEVRVLFLHEEGFTGSVRQAHPEDDPLRDTETSAVGQEYRARVTSVGEAVAFFALPAGMEGGVCIDGADVDLVEGQTRWVRITRIDWESRRIMSS